MHPEYWVESVLGTRAKVRILRTLSRQPGRWWTEREVAAAAGLSPNTVSLSTRGLLDAGVVSIQRLGNSNGIRLRHEHEFLAPLLALFAAERETVGKMSDAIARALPRGATAYVFGSTARGDASSGSDVDVAVVAKDRATADECVAKIITAASAVFPVVPRVIGFDRREFDRRHPAPLVLSVIKEGVVVSPAVNDV